MTEEEEEEKTGERGGDGKRMKCRNMQTNMCKVGPRRDEKKK